MLKSILNLEGVQELKKEAQKGIQGGIQFPIGCVDRRDCFFIDRASRCINRICVFL
ncbi:hypothetical protein KORDIASMS9_00347 [Kordia sp. SMS9]|uniref:hypothetical protein n=1 Tax=Kordia sp. SMS9 TaxID=2282170 RepID=UPI000E105468|nr:hypothetical protein [Kordia sp. SMS9]AXG68157.1 hypothetical protein KORDIASMS9_00347 [Kordia sp. SMS9]